MKVAFLDKVLDQDFKSLKRRVELEGDTLVKLEDGPDLVFSKDEIQTESVCVKPISHLPKVVSESFGFKIDLKSFGDQITLCKFFSHGVYQNQTLAGIPLKGCLSGGMGEDVISGVCSNFIRSDTTSEMFNQPDFVNYLQESKYFGFVSLNCKLLKDKLFVQGICLGLPYHLIYNVITGAKGRVSELFTGQVPKLKESWVVNLYLTKFPWPSVTDCDRTHLGGLTQNLERYFWPFDLQGFDRKSLYTDSRFIGCATSWGNSLPDASALAKRTCKSLQVSKPQYRIDATQVAGSIWQNLTRSLETIQN